MTPFTMTPLQDWRNDHRLVIAEELAGHGHRVEHLRADGSVALREKKMAGALCGGEVLHPYVSMSRTKRPM